MFLHVRYGYAYEAQYEQDDIKSAFFMMMVMLDFLSERSLHRLILGLI